MNSPTLASLAPGVPVAGKMVSPTSFKNAISSFDKLKAAAFLSEVLQPEINASAPIKVPPNSNATLEMASLLFILYNLKGFKFCKSNLLNCN